jgi:hypothetical protein
MTGVMRFLFALLLGVVLGAAGTVYLIQSDAGNLVVRQTDVVQDLQRRLADVEAQRNQLSRQLEDVVTRASRMEQAFDALEKRFHGLADERTPGTQPPPAPATPPSTQAP